MSFNKSWGILEKINLPIACFYISTIELFKTGQFRDPLSSADMMLNTISTLSLTDGLITIRKGEEIDCFGIDFLVVRAL